MQKGFLYSAVLLGLLLVSVCFAANSGKLLGDESDGSKAEPVHIMPLYDEADPLLGKEKQQILSTDRKPAPFSTFSTCGACHSYSEINKGWHFNASDPNVNPGRVGQPWIFVDSATCTVVALSYRDWPGSFNPEQIGLGSYKFTRLFGRQMPGGGCGEVEDEQSEEILLQMASGKLRINCLSCHNANPAYDQKEFAWQVSVGNFSWAATAACEFADVKGSIAGVDIDTYDPLTSDAISTTYDKKVFNEKSHVFFDVGGKVSDNRCYFCHSNVDLDEYEGQKWAADEDVHLKAGLSCVDCHRQGLTHNTVRGYEGEENILTNPLAATSSCKGCHTAGRLGAPKPEHAGIPPIHFEKLTCTACHSGPWPEEETHHVKTSRAHALGTLNANKSPDLLPHIQSAVFAVQQDGRIAPHKLIWPAFWGCLKDNKVLPVNIDIVRQTVGKVLSAKKTPDSGSWPDVNEDDIKQGLKALSSQQSLDGVAVYLSGGRCYQLDEKGELINKDRPEAEPYMWPLAHDVRPAAQSLGVRKCQDCHSTKEGFFFGKVAVDTPIISAQNLSKEMISFQKLPRCYTRLFAMSFVFRPMLKVVTLCSCAVIAAVLLLYGLKALLCIAKIMVGKD